MKPEDREGMPRWVKVFGLVLIAAVLTIAVLHLTGNSLSGHVLHGGMHADGGR